MTLKLFYSLLAFYFWLMYLDFKIHKTCLFVSILVNKTSNYHKLFLVTKLIFCNNPPLLLALLHPCSNANNN